MSKGLMGTQRLEAFSDGVIAIIITIMVLELKVPHGDTLHALQDLWPVFLSYVLSFVYLGIYWNNHHHLLHATQRVSASILWANLNLLFWLSLIPFVTSWMGENHFTKIPTALYGVNLLMAAIAYWILQNQIVKAHGHDSNLAKVFSQNLKGNISPIIYFIAIVTSFYCQWIAGALYALVAVMWLIPDKRAEAVVNLRN